MPVGRWQLKVVTIRLGAYRGLQTYSASQVVGFRTILSGRMSASENPSHHVSCLGKEVRAGLRYYREEGHISTWTDKSGMGREVMKVVPAGTGVGQAFSVSVLHIVCLKLPWGVLTLCPFHHPKLKPFFLKIKVSLQLLHLALKKSV